MMTNTTSAITPADSSPTYMTLDLFELLDACETLSDELIESNNQAWQQTLYHRLANCLETMQTELEKTLPPYLIQRLTVEKLVDTQPQHLAEDSELLRQYCYALTQVLISQKQTTEVNKTLNELLFELVNMLIEDLLLPRFEKGVSG
ncbi:hypothetical protein MUA02_03400 [Enterobacteriaceae bacterium H20N1]|uniref:Uncharacterized protein n=1 Tax=Dryocola boscaweniae TaxID=2925397 RepID=A0A9X2W4S4_9ENTR|nr:hypothetical protein [Dryocola boscaweniae]MCT4701048.1 hypothetical protein [Dryocola boscaweniae]MCT4714564.1 hypothetical protein [Dryocola boscaweniae]MCT4718092.1 hypothetical protein [Dryocola boscaweniae]